MQITSLDLGQVEVKHLVVGGCIKSRRNHGSRVPPIGKETGPIENLAA
jgi:hypothetical protein